MFEEPQAAATRTQSDVEVPSLPSIEADAPVAPVSNSALRAFTHREFLWLCTGAFVSNVGTWMERVAVGVWVTETTGKAAATGAVTAMIFLPVAIFGPLGGALSDRANRRRWLINVTVAQAVVAAVLAALASLHWLTVPLVSVLMFLTGCTSVLLSAGFNAVMSELVPAKDLTSAIFLNSGQWNLARVIGPLIAAPVIAFGSASLAFWVNAVSFGAVLFAVVKMRVPPRSAPVHHEPLRHAVLGGFRAMRADPAIASALSMLAVGGFFIAPFVGLIPVFAMQTLSAGPAAASFLVAAQGFGAVFAALISASLLDRVGVGRWMRTTCLVLCVLTVAYWLTPSLGWALAVMVPLGAAYLSLVTGTSRVCLGRAPLGSQARVSALFHMTIDATYATGLVVAGAIADRVGLRETGVAFALIFGVGLLILARSRRHLFTSLG